MEKIRQLIQKVRIEFYVLASLIMVLIAFSTNYYTTRIGDNLPAGFNLFDMIFNEKIGWIFFVVIVGGYLTTVVSLSLDNHYSKRTKWCFITTIAFTAVVFVCLVLWLLIDDAFFFGKETMMDITYKGRFGFGFYWFILHLITTGGIAYFYQEYEGAGEGSLFHSVFDGFKKSKKTDQIVAIPIKDKYEELRKIKALFDEDVLTEEEFQNEKQSILNNNK